MHTIASMASDLDDREVSRRAADAGIVASQLSSCYWGRGSRTTPGLIVGFAAYSETEISHGIRALARVLTSGCDRKGNVPRQANRVNKSTSSQPLHQSTCELLCSAFATCEPRPVCESPAVRRCADGSGQQSYAHLTQTRVLPYLRLQRKMRASMVCRLPLLRSSLNEGAFMGKRMIGALGIATVTIAALRFVKCG